jgi:hypothetical protein
MSLTLMAGNVLVFGVGLEYQVNFCAAAIYLCIVRPFYYYSLPPSLNTRPLTLGLLCNFQDLDIFLLEYVSAFVQSSFI